MADGSGPINVAAALGVTRRKRIVVGFAGGGGSSLACEMALDRHPDAALNHWTVAIGVHAANFPGAEHHCADIMETDCRSVLPGEAIGLLWLSPDCRHFSKAKGGAPVSDRIRGLAWCAIPWIRLRRPDVVMIENVEEFITWGPLIKRANPKTSDVEAYPDPDRRGETFRRWVSRFEQLGYVWDVKTASVAADFGAPTIRKRLIFIARCDGLPIIWPEPTHGPRHSEAVKSGKLKPYASAASIIDWSRDCPSIFMTPEEAMARRLKRPLKEATLKRIAKGLFRYTIANAEPFIVQLTHTGSSDRTRGVSDQLPTITGAHRGEIALVTPNMVRTDMSGAKFAGANSAEDPLRTATSGGGLAVSEAMLSPVITGCGGRMGQTQPVDPAGPYPTITAKNDSCLASAYLTKFSENSIGDMPDEPLHTVMAGAPRHGLVISHLEQMNTRSAGRDLAEPLATPVSHAHDAVVSAFTEQANTGMAGHSAEAPLSTIVGRGTTQRLIAAQLSHAYTSNTAGGEGDPGKPIKTVLAGGNHAYLVESDLIAPSMMAYYGADNVADVTEPMLTATSKSRIGLVEAHLVRCKAPRPSALAAFLAEHYGDLTEADIANPLATVESRARWGVVMVPNRETGSAEPWQIVDIGMRMLDPETELAAAMGVRADYVLSRDADGNRVSKTDITRMVGNMVCPPWAAAHIRANCQHLMGDLR